MGEGRGRRAVLKGGEHERVLVGRGQLWRDFSGSTGAVTDSPCRPPGSRAFGTVVQGPASLCPAALSVPRGETVPGRCCVYVARGRGGDAVITASAVVLVCPRSARRLCAWQDAASLGGRPCQWEHERAAAGVPGSVSTSRDC